MGARVLRKREERQGIYMKRKVISALLACTLLAGSAVPALAAGETATGQTPAGIGAGGARAQDPADGRAGREKGGAGG